MGITITPLLTTQVIMGTTWNSEFESILKTERCYADKYKGLRALETVHHDCKINLCSQCLKVNIAQKIEV